ncbi:MAG: heavy-metal-associated domain-containing protein [Bacillota bacterium]
MMNKKTIAVGGMSCEHCVATIKEKLNSLTGIKNVNIDLDSGQVEVSYDSSDINLEEIEQGIKDAGYEVV